MGNKQVIIINYFALEAYERVSEEENKKFRKVSTSILLTRLSMNFLQMKTLYFEIWYNIYNICQIVREGYTSIITHFIDPLVQYELRKI